MTRESSPPPVRRPRSAWFTVARVVALSASLVAWTVIIAVATVSTNLRPLADDYCHAARGTLGYVESLVFWFGYWIGDLVQLAITALLVGQPLVHLPFSIASAIPFFATVTVIAGTAVVVLLGTAVGSRADRILFASLIIPTVMITWWAFWWIPATIDPSQTAYPWLLAAAITDWQTVAVQYALVPALLIGAGILLEFRRSRRRWLTVTLFAALGLASGLGGLVFALAALALMPILLLARVIHDRSLSTARLIETGVFVGAGLVGVAIAYFAPGARRRNEGLLDSRPFGENVSLNELITWVLPHGVTNWVEMVLGAGTVIAFVIGAALALASTKLSVVVRPVRLVTIGLALTGFSLLIALASRAADGFSYEGFWHDVLPRTVLFLGILALGAGAGARVGQDSTPGTGRIAQIVVLAAAGTVLVAALGSLVVMQEHIDERLVQWEVGAAPSSSLDLGTSWVDRCWATLGEVRELPDRVP